MNEPLNQHPLVTPDHLRRLAVIYIRQSTEEQVRENVGSTAYQRSLTAVAQSYGWPDSLIETIDEDLGKSGSASERRTGWQRLHTMIAAGASRCGFCCNHLSSVAAGSRFRTFSHTSGGVHKTLALCRWPLFDPADSSDTFFSQITAMDRPALRTASEQNS